MICRPNGNPISDKTRGDLAQTRWTWVVVELSPEGEDLAAADRLAAQVRADLRVPRQYPVLVPKSRGAGGASSLSYAFVRSGLPSGRYFALERRPYVERILSRDVGGGLRTLCLVSSREVTGMLRAVEKPKATPLVRGQGVEVVSGSFLRVRGRVLGQLSAREVLVQVQTRSLLRLLVLNRSDLAPVDDQTISPVFVPDLRRFRPAALPRTRPTPPRAPAGPTGRYDAYQQMSLFS